MELEIWSPKRERVHVYTGSLPWIPYFQSRPKQISPQQVDFYNDITKYLSELQNTTIRSVDDIIAFDDRDALPEGGFPVGCSISH
jgi:hypothetical protein